MQTTIYSGSRWTLEQGSTSTRTLFCFLFLLLLIDVVFLVRVLDDRGRRGGRGGAAAVLAGRLRADPRHRPRLVRQSPHGRTAPHPARLRHEGHQEGARHRRRGNLSPHAAFLDAILGPASCWNSRAFQLWNTAVRDDDIQVDRGKLNEPNVTVVELDES